MRCVAFLLCLLWVLASSATLGPLFRAGSSATLLAQTVPLPPPLAPAGLPSSDRLANWSGDVREIRARLTNAPPPGPPGVTTSEALPTAIAVLSDLPAAGPLPIDRHPQLSPDHLVLVNVDVSGQALSWQLAYDPRVLRSESANGSGNLRGETLTQSSAELRFVIPDDDRITAVHVYQPVWTGSAFTLRPLGICSR